MDFTFSSEQKLFREVVADFASREIGPWVPVMEKEDRFPKELFQQMGDMGFYGVLYPEEYGGSALNMVAQVILHEELAKVSAVAAGVVQVHAGLATSLIHRFGSEDLKQRYLVPAIRGEMIGALGLTEPGAGSDVAGIQTRAQRTPGGYIVNGSKMFISNGPIADFISIAAVTDRSKGRKGISLLVVPRGTAGLDQSKRLEKHGMHGSETGELFFTDCDVPEANLVGEEGQGFSYLMNSLNEGRICVGGISLGIAKTALRLAKEYATQREQFGRKISEFQAIGFMLADMALEVELAELMVYKAAWLYDQGKECRREVSMAKLYASEVAMRVANQSLQIHGGYGYMREYAIERFYRDARLYTIVEGTSEVQRQIIAKTLLD